MQIDMLPLAQILHRSFAKFLRLTSQGLVFPDGKIRTQVSARIHHAHPTRTLYQNRKPVCRSLDGFTPRNRRLAEHCVACQARDRCTAQLNLQLRVQGAPYNVLLSYSSLKNFLEFRANLPRPVEQGEVTLKVLDRGRWGELTFHPADLAQK